MELWKQPEPVTSHLGFMGYGAVQQGVKVMKGVLGIADSISKGLET